MKHAAGGCRVGFRPPLGAEPLGLGSDAFRSLPRGVPSDLQCHPPVPALVSHCRPLRRVLDELTLAFLPVSLLVSTDFPCLGDKPFLLKSKRL